MTLFLIAFVAGVLTVLAPCVLPLLPIIVGGTVSGGVNRMRAYTVAISLGVSVILFTLILKFSTAFINIPQYAWWEISGGILIVFGFITLFPTLWDRIGFVNTVSRSSNKVLSQGFMQQSFWGDVLVGASLGPVFSTCSPTYFVILATVLPASFGVGLADLFAYTLGLVGMLLVVGIVGQQIVDKLGIASDPKGWFKRGIGILFIVVGVVVATGAEQPLEAWLISHVYDITMIEQKLLQTQQKQDSPINLDSASSTKPMPAVSSSSTPEEKTTALISASKKSMQYQKAPELTDIDGYINTDGKPITISQFKGKKVVLIDFWTYSCINCQRTLPYLKAWYDKYHDAGLEIIGVHTPEFSFEHLKSNVEAAVTGFGLKYPVVLDNNYGTWNAFGNIYWPRKYLIDIDGYIVFDHAGEGNYDGTERAIQKALEERSARLKVGAPETNISNPAGAEDVDHAQLGSPEIYFGAMRNQYFGNGMSGETGTQVLRFPDNNFRNNLYLSGTWDIYPEYAESLDENGGIRVAYRAKDVYFVADSQLGTKIHVLLDGADVPAGDRGADLDATSHVKIKEDRLYKIIESKDYGNHVLEIKIEGKGLKVYTFTFG